MIEQRHTRRLRGLGIFLFLIFIGLGLRLVFLQVISHDHYRKVAFNNTQSLSFRQARRGDILDVNGNPLAISLPVKRVVANPALMGPHYVEVARRLAPLLAYQETELIQRLRPTVVRTNQGGLLVTNQHVELRRKLTLEQWQQVTQAMATLHLNVDETRLGPTARIFYQALRQQSIYPEDDQQRFYPNTNLAAHVIGFAQDTETNFNGNIVLRDLTGRDGIEAWLDPKLRGARGWRITETDRKKREILPGRTQEVDARPGLNVVLTLDLVIQNIVENELADAMKKNAPLSVSSVVVRPRTGEILAMSTLPNYDPNHPGQSSPDALRNRIISDLVEPGSTFKIVVVSAALNENVVKLTDMFDCEHGKFIFRGVALHDDHEGHGALSVEDIIMKSSNIGAAKIGIKLGEDHLYDYIRAFGFGEKSEITLGGEVRGKVHPVREWDKLMISRIPMGHAVSVTPLQITMAMCALANDGKLMRPMLVKRMQEPTGDVCAEYEPQVVRQVVRPETARTMVEALKTVATKDGTAVKARMDHYTVAGKTGTARKVVGRMYSPTKYISSFIGFFPADDPQICISVIFDEPNHGFYGGQVAAPVFRKIAEQVANYLKIKPDPEEPPPGTEVSLETLRTAGIATQAP